MKSSPRTFRHSERSDITRARLIQAAEKIFARDGFEAARLEEIAAEAGYTRGAFYANFATKQDLFLALLEREIASHIANIEKQIAGFREPVRKLQALREFLEAMSQDRRWSLLSLEFKLFAVRHPGARARLAAMNRRLLGARVGILRAVMEGSGRKLPASVASVAMSFSSVTHALALEHMLDRAAMPEEELKKILGNYFDSVTGALHAGKSGAKQPSTRTRR